MGVTQDGHEVITKCPSGELLVAGRHNETTNVLLDADSHGFA
jgi:hypothetical protein